MSAGRSRPQEIEHRRVVVKVGTNLLTGGGAALDLDAMSRIVEQVVALRERGGQVIVVTSGAIAAGRERLGDFEAHRDVPRRQVLAAAGQSRLMSRWDDLFESRGLVSAQSLLTRGDLADRLAHPSPAARGEEREGEPLRPAHSQRDGVAVDCRLRRGRPLRRVAALDGERQRLLADVAAVLVEDGA